MKLVYPAIFTPCIEREGYTVEIPDLPGCVTEGKDLVEAIEMGVDAASGWVLSELEEGNDIPKPSLRENIKLEEPESFISMLVLDIDSYAEKYGTRAVTKNITIPAWLNTYAEKNNINFSKVLQDSLFKIANVEHGEIISKEDFRKAKQIVNNKAVTPPGYKMVDGKIVVDKAEADIIKEAFSNVENGKKLDDELLNAQRKLKELK